jgi:hypothetical protein
LFVSPKGLKRKGTGRDLSLKLGCLFLRHDIPINQDVMSKVVLVIKYFFEGEFFNFSETFQYFTVDHIFVS